MLYLPVLTIETECKMTKSRLAVLTQGEGWACMLESG
jgi:hypothetical protein